MLIWLFPFHHAIPIYPPHLQTQSLYPRPHELSVIQLPLLLEVILSKPPVKRLNKTIILGLETYYRWEGTWLAGHWTRY